VRGAHLLALLGREAEHYNGGHVRVSVLQPMVEDFQKLQFGVRAFVEALGRVKIGIQSYNGSQRPKVHNADATPGSLAVAASERDFSPEGESASASGRR
jgi:hypothetical protein